MKKVQSLGLLTVNGGNETVTLLRKDAELSEDVMYIIDRLQEKHPDFSLI